MTPPPPEWAPLSRIYTAWPWRRREWHADLEGAQKETAALVRAIAEGGTKVVLLVSDMEQERAANNMVGRGQHIEYARTRYGDIWLRDTGPFFTDEGAQAFRFNGWGGKYRMAGDERVAAALARREGARLVTHDFVFEGGASDHDGTGLAITTEQCLLNPNRNGETSADEMEEKLAGALGFDRIVWLGHGIVNDHTDGHVDNLARFTAPGRVIVPEALEPSDRNGPVYEGAAERLDAAGLDVARIPAPGRVTGARDETMPASYVNFLLTNERVIIPTYGTSHDERAVSAIGAEFPDREAVGLPANHILAGGGAFHCMTREVPDFSSRDKSA